jgi:glycosyltransferase involved in cell wall biosynthesis
MPLIGSRTPKLNIWWLSQYASTPDQQFTAQHDLARRLVEKGHQVTFFAAGFSHYKFKEIRLKPGEMWRVELHDGVRFVWIKTAPYRANNWRRLLNICSYAWRAYRIGRSLHETPDIIIGTTFHPLASLSACALSRAKNCPFVFEVKDLWPLTVIEFGKLSPRSPIATAMRVLERQLARRAARIMTTLSGAADYFAGLGIPEKRISWIPNGLELDRYKTVTPYSGKLSDRCTLLYAGGHVSASPLDTVLEAAKIEQGNGDRVRFVFVGGGQDKERLVHRAHNLGLKNVDFRDAVPKSELFRVVEQADAFIVTMRDLPRLYRYGTSFNKLCDYLASGRPVLFAGSAKPNVVEDYECGIVVPPENPKAFAAAIHKFLSLTDEQRAQMGRNGIRCARERFDMRILATRLEEMLLLVHQEKSSGPSASRRQVDAMDLSHEKEALSQPN